MAASANAPPLGVPTKYGRRFAKFGEAGRVAVLLFTMEINGTKLEL